MRKRARKRIDIEAPIKYYTAPPVNCPSTVMLTDGTV
jgi:hypothetical protein